jgi:FkbM family methyltransferase
MYLEENSYPFISVRGHHFYSKYLNSNATIVDLGSHLGEFSSEISKMFGCNCYAVEAFPELYTKIQTNGLIKKYNYAICKHNDSIIFSVSNNLEASHIIQKKDESKNSIIVQGITFKDFINKYHITNIDLLKIDIEGAEIDLFDSINDETLTNIKQLTIEFHDFVFPVKKEVKSIIKRLKKLGFYCIKFSWHTNGDILFINRNQYKFSYIDYLVSKYIVRNFYVVKRGLKKIL